MKRLITIFLTLTGFVCLRGQTGNLPVVVLGDVYVGDTNVKSVGSFHVKPQGTEAAGAELGGVVENHGTLAVDDTLYLYSYDKVDGFVLNLNTTANAVKPKVLAVKKYFGAVDAAGWKAVVFPFPVEVGTKGAASPGVTNSAGTPLNLRGAGGFSASYFNPQLRADRGNVMNIGVNDTNWGWLNDNDSLKNVPAYGGNATANANGGKMFMTAGEGYRITRQSSNPDPYIVFLTNVDTIIEKAFKYDNKTKGLVYKSAPTIWATFNGAGWNLIGGLSPTTFEVPDTNITCVTEYDGQNDADAVIYYTEDNGATYPKQICVSDVNLRGLSNGQRDSLLISPYVPFYFQTKDTKLTFTYAKERLTAAKADVPGFRASAAVNPDNLYINMKYDDNKPEERKTATTAIKLGSTFSDSFVPTEDALWLDYTYNSQRLAIWSIEETVPTEINRLYINRMPLHANTPIRLGVNVPWKADYVISLLNRENLSSNINSVILVDLYNKKEIDLLREDYKVYSGVGVNENNYYLYINRTKTGIESLFDKNVYAYADDNILTVKNITEGDKIQVYDVAGRTIASGKAISDEFKVPVTAKGVYLVNVKGAKNAVLKVLNK
ncbi:MAG: T9SS type A sorting domain-containing protein [Dysgonamonadaceae bacterium]|jgi:hypothetical protein|nr:T9SS type A sorting domain-containing protein [Dysgonamonadaceae bacterium]